MNLLNAMIVLIHFFYIDPPYYKTSCYKHNFHKLDDFVAIADVLRDIKGKFILSLNDHPEIRKVFKDFDLKPVKIRYSVSAKQSTEGAELIIRKKAA